MKSEDIPDMRPKPDASEQVLIVLALVVAFVSIVLLIAVVEIRVYDECRAHGFSATYCLWK